jgi:hypothetical protein
VEAGSKETKKPQKKRTAVTNPLRREVLLLPLSGPFQDWAAAGSLVGLRNNEFSPDLHFQSDDAFTEQQPFHPGVSFSGISSSAYPADEATTVKL